MSAIRAVPIALQDGMDVTKAWLLGFLAGDGHIQCDWVRSSFKVSASCGFDRDMAHYVAGLFEEIYGAKGTVVERRNVEPPRHTTWIAYCNRKEVAADLRKLAPFGRHKWRVPKAVLEASPEVKAAWISGFAEADGCVTYVPERSQRQVSLDSVNAEGLAQVEGMFNSLGIEFSRASHDRKIKGHSRAHKLILCNHVAVKRFAELVGFKGKAKAAKLEAAVSSYERLPRKLEDLVGDRGPEIKKQREAGKSWAEIGLQLGLTREQVRTYCRKHKIEGKCSGWSSLRKRKDPFEGGPNS